MSKPPPTCGVKLKTWARAGLSMLSADDPGAPLDMGQNRGKEETTEFKQGRKAQFKAGVIGASDAGDALYNKGGSEGAPVACPEA